jgi:hypothetical protein
MSRFGARKVGRPCLFGCSGWPTIDSVSHDSTWCGAAIILYDCYSSCTYTVAVAYSAACKT